MEWTEITITVPNDELETAEAIAQMTVPYGIYIEDYANLEEEAMEIAHIDLIDEELLKKDRQHAIVHMYISPENSPAEALAFLQERCTAEKLHAEIRRAAVSEEDWANEWKKYFKPLETGRKLAICPTWESYDNRDGRTVMRIDPGMAFGTGGHATTRLCLETLEDYVQPGTELLDLGCGSGILSIAALLMGASRTVGVDIDPLAVKTARENGHLNGFDEPQYTVLEGNLTDKVSGTFDVVAANIVADVIIFFCPQVRQFMKPGAVFVTSGIIDTREQDVRKAFAENGLEIQRRRENGGWLSFVCVAK
ncbi:MAG: 50S ribosomal protein L11 methyltransferase [Clostridia bacterium]|nr:50S ribosomal protein L11 methyltransferase [Clostridia bacterium]